MQKGITLNLGYMLLIYDNHILELRDEELNRREEKIMAVVDATFAVAKRKLGQKNQACKGESSLERCSNPAQQDFFRVFFLLLQKLRPQLNCGDLLNV